MNEQEQFENWWKEDIDTTMNPYSNTSMMYWAWEAWKAGRKAEREACAKFFEDNESEIFFGAQAASALRAKGQALGGKNE